MKRKLFCDVAAGENNSNWSNLIHREKPLYKRDEDIRSEFSRDYTRVLHSLAYRRLKHKTQVFYNVDDDHICTRMEHVSHVESVSSTLAEYMGLNCELAKAIATSHDLGHAPFGHYGESVISKLREKYVNKSFWHESNGLRFVDKIELLQNDNNKLINLNLTYATRDGIISHCGEIDFKSICPRKENIDLNLFNAPGSFQPYTWEGCVVKISDKIAYLGRDVEDALSLGFIEKKDVDKLSTSFDNADVINTTVIMHKFIYDLCENSSPEKGICFSDKAFERLNKIKKFNYEKIYLSSRFNTYKNYAKLVIESIFEVLAESYDNKDIFNNLSRLEKKYPLLAGSFINWLSKYVDITALTDSSIKSVALEYENDKIYGLIETKEIYCQAIIDFLSGTTDRFAEKLFSELITFAKLNY